MDFEPGDEVVVWNENHQKNGEVAWEIRKASFPNINIVTVDLEGEQMKKILLIGSDPKWTKTLTLCRSARYVIQPFPS